MKVKAKKLLGNLMAAQLRSILRKLASSCVSAFTAEAMVASMQSLNMPDKWLKATQSAECQIGRASKRK